MVNVKYLLVEFYGRVMALMAKKWFAVLTGLLVLLVAATAAAAPAGSAAGLPPGDGVNAIAVEQWTGKVFTVLPLERGGKAAGYAFTLVTERPDLLTPAGSIRADWLEGKRLEVTAVKRLPAYEDGPPVTDYEVVFRETGGGVVLAAKALGGQVAQMVPAEDLAGAQKRFAGKTVFSKRTAIPAFQEEPGTIKVKINEPLKVEDVIAGISADEPIWLVVSTAEGSKGYIAIAYSLTNVHPGIWMTARPWEAVLFEEDPRTLYAWDEQTWAAINDGVAKTGMVPDQVRLAWGEPLNVVRADGEETWYYPDKIVKFHPAAGLFLIQSR